MKIYKEKTYEDMSKRAADIIAEQIKNKPDSVLGLATGSTPIGMYEKLVEKYNNHEIDFSKITTINLDEYKGLDPENNQSYHYFMNEHLFSKVNIPSANIHLPDGKEEDEEKVCKEYDDIIEKSGGIDIQVLGIGENGHIGFNEPSDKFSKGTNCVNLTKNTIEVNSRFFKSIDEVPTKAYTMGIESIFSAKKIILMANSKKKADILKKALTGDITPEVPASILQKHPDVVVIGDEEALRDF